MRYAIEAWAPEYGASAGGIDAEVIEPTAMVERSIEIPEERWAPITPRVPAPACIAFVDGISRVDAQVWISEESGDMRPGLCATYAAGAVLCDGTARVADPRVHRGLFTSSGAAKPISTSHAIYEVRPSAGGMEELSLAVVERMRALEADVARAVTGADLIVLDGLLWGRADIAQAVGYVKSHHTPYLPAELNALVSALQPGERTPLFLVKTTWTRFSWYMRLPGGSGHPWSGVVRCEASPDLDPQQASALADATTAGLPAFASSRHKDARAPANLYPIGGLERELRRRAGDSQLLLRGLLSAARAATN
ncbi:MAG TPA: hypothetical protein VM600_08970 [Actinomycetota bacterium]|nr:hypothetical protein [Actinomycetota bacterium]